MTFIMLNHIIIVNEVFAVAGTGLVITSFCIYYNPYIIHIVFPQYFVSLQSLQIRKHIKLNYFNKISYSNKIY